MTDKTYTCRFCKRVYYCNKTVNPDICYHVGMIIKRTFTRPEVTEFSGEYRYINGNIKVNAEYYDWLCSFTWQTAKVNKGYTTSNVIVNGKETTFRIHRLIMDAQPGQIVDHINRDRFDNTIENLRFVTMKQNSHNSSTFDNAKNYYYQLSSKKWVPKYLGKPYAYLETEQEAIDYVERYIKPLKDKIRMDLSVKEQVVS